MSIQAMTWVLAHSETHAESRLVMISIANHSSPSGDQAYPSLPLIAREARCDRSTVWRIVQRLWKAGHIDVIKGGGRKNPHVYTVVMDPALIDKKRLQRATLSWDDIGGDDDPSGDGWGLSSTLPDIDAEGDLDDLADPSGSSQASTAGGPLKGLGGATVSPVDQPGDEDLGSEADDTKWHEQRSRKGRERVAPGARNGWAPQPESLLTGTGTPPTPPSRVPGLTSDEVERRLAIAASIGRTEALVDQTELAEIAPLVTAKFGSVGCQPPTPSEFLAVLVTRAEQSWTNQRAAIAATRADRSA